MPKRRRGEKKTTYFDYNQFVFEKLTKVHGIVKMQSSFVLNEIKHTTVLNIPKNS